MNPRKRPAEGRADPSVSTKRRLNNNISISISSRVVKVHFSTDQNSEQTATTDIYQGLSDEESRALRSQIWYTVRTVQVQSFYCITLLFE
jgi:hypothetical protein